ncbi:hypothetical protein AAC387_Pa08g0702 [Persea americana]
MQFPVFLLSEWRRTGKSTFSPMGVAVKLRLPAFLLLERWKAGKSSLPPKRAAVKLQLPAFLHSQWKIRFTADESGGKAPTASFPPLTVEESWKMRLYRPCKRR